VAEGKELWRAKTSAPAGRIIFSSDGRVLAQCDGEGGIRIWQATSGQDLGRFLYGPGKRLALSGDGRRLVVQSDRDVGRGPCWSASLWELATKRLLREITTDDGIAYEGAGNALALSADGSRLAVGQG